MEKYYGELAHYIDEFFLSEEKYRDHSYLSNIRISTEYMLAILFKQQHISFKLENNKMTISDYITHLGHNTSFIEQNEIEILNVIQTCTNFAVHGKTGMFANAKWRKACVLPVFYEFAKYFAEKSNNIPDSLMEKLLLLPEKIESTIMESSNIKEQQSSKIEEIESISIASKSISIQLVIKEIESIISDKVSYIKGNHYESSKYAFTFVTIGNDRHWLNIPVDKVSLMANGEKVAFVIILDASYGRVIIPLKEESGNNINNESFFEFLIRNPARTNNVCWDCKLEHDAITLIKTKDRFNYTQKPLEILKNYIELNNNLI
jgi:hypothetical protein